MAKRCVSKITIGDTDYPLMQFSDMSFVSDSMTTWTYVRASSISGTVAPNTNFFDIDRGTTTTITRDTNYTNFKYEHQWRNSKNYVIFKYVDGGNSWNDFGSSEDSENIYYHYGIILDDDTQKAYVIAAVEDAGYYVRYRSDYYNLFYVAPIVNITSNGGGATHIAKVTGQLKDLSSNLSDILMVSGGGGGGLLVGDTDYSGKEAGGISGSGDNSADQSTGNAFGQGESGTNVSGGGSGLYGGYKGTSSKSGGAGSGYIGNSLLLNKKMVGYNVPTSSSEGTKTESVNVYSASGEANKPKSGNGKAKIKFVRELQKHSFTSIIQTSLNDTTKLVVVNNNNADPSPTSVYPYINTDNNIENGYDSRTRPHFYLDDGIIKRDNVQNFCYMRTFVKLKETMTVRAISFKLTLSGQALYDSWQVEFGAELYNITSNSSEKLGQLIRNITSSDYEDGKEFFVAFDSPISINYIGLLAIDGAIVAEDFNLYT